jgi:hypothetical protein
VLDDLRGRYCLVSRQNTSYQGSPEALEQAAKLGLEPKHSFELGGVTYRFSDVVNGRKERLFVLAEVRTQQSSFLRVFYRSGSQGVFRVLPMVLPSGRFEKGSGSNTLSLPPEVQLELAALSRDGKVRKDIDSDKAEWLLTNLVPNAGASHEADVAQLAGCSPSKS